VHKFAFFSFLLSYFFSFFPSLFLSSRIVPSVRTNLLKCKVQLESPGQWTSIIDVKRLALALSYIKDDED